MGEVIQPDEILQEIPQPATTYRQVPSESEI